MIRLINKLNDNEKHKVSISGTLSLPIDIRVRSRAKVLLDDGREAGLFLPRGGLLRDGDILQTETSDYIQVKAAPQRVSTLTDCTPLMLVKAAYHLGNRHIPLQIEPGMLRYQHDPVLDDMLAGMQLIVRVSSEPFEPEPGAYQRIAHDHLHPLQDVNLTRPST